MTPAGHAHPLVAIVGPTAVGKTALALRLADELPVEVVSADSRQVYRYMDIGTAKPTAQERQRVKHHLLDIVNPDEPFTLAQYQQLAYAAIDDVQRRGRIPLLVGGSGLCWKDLVSRTLSQTRTCASNSTLKRKPRVTDHCTAVCVNWTP